MKIRRFILILFFGTLILCYRPVDVFADDPGPELPKRIRIASLVSYAYHKNPSILAAKEEWKAVIEKYRVATGYPDPMLSFTYFPEPIETRLGPQDWNVNISQTIPFPGKLSKLGEMVEADARIAELRLDKTVGDVILAVKESYYELLYIRNAKRVAHENLSLLNHLRKVGETAYAEDRAGLMDMVKAQSQLGQLRYDTLLLGELEHTEQTRLNSLLDRAPDAEVGELAAFVFRPLGLDLDQLYALAEKNQEGILMAEVKVKKAEANADLARYEGMPDFKVGIFYASIGDPNVANPPSNAGKDAVGVQVGMTLPLWFGKNTGRKKSAHAMMRTAKAETTARINKSREEIRSHFFRLRNAQRLMELYRDELMPQAARAMEVAEIWFREGEASFSDFVETQSVWYNFQLSLARAQADYGKYLSRLERAVGKLILDSYGIQQEKE